MAEDIPRAAQACEWSVLRLDQADPPADPGKPTIQAALLLPDGRTAHVIAVGAADGDSASAVAAFDVRIRVGRLGDPAREKTFLKQLSKTLRGKPMRQRIKFELPPAGEGPGT